MMAVTAVGPAGGKAAGSAHGSRRLGLGGCPPRLASGLRLRARRLLGRLSLLQQGPRRRSGRPSRVVRVHRRSGPAGSRTARRVQGDHVTSAEPRPPDSEPIRALLREVLTDLGVTVSSPTTRCPAPLAAPTAARGAVPDRARARTRGGRPSSTTPIDSVSRWVRWPGPRRASRSPSPCGGPCRRGGCRWVPRSWPPPGPGRT